MMGQCFWRRFPVSAKQHPAPTQRQSPARRTTAGQSKCNLFVPDARLTPCAARNSHEPLREKKFRPFGSGCIPAISHATPRLQAQTRAAQDHPWAKNPQNSGSSYLRVLRFPRPTRVSPLGSWGLGCGVLTSAGFGSCLGHRTSVDGSAETSPNPVNPNL